MHTDDPDRLRLEHDGDRWHLAGSGADGLGLVDEYLGYLAHRNYSPKTLRAYGFDLVMFGRWLLGEAIGIDEVTTRVLLRYLAACREARLPGRPGPNVVDMAGRRLDGYATATVNRRLVAVSGLFAFRAMRDPSLPSSVPKSREAQRFVPNEKTGLLAHLVRKPRPRSALRLREPRRLPRPLTVSEAAGLLASLRTWRDRAMAGLMLRNHARPLSLHAAFPPESGGERMTAGASTQSFSTAAVHVTSLLLTASADQSDDTW